MVEDTTPVDIIQVDTVSAMKLASQYFEEDSSICNSRMQHQLTFDSSNVAMYYILALTDFAHMQYHNV